MAKFENQKYIFNEDFSSEEFVYVAFSMLETRGYHGLIELMSIIDDPSKIMQILYLFNGMEIKMPKSTEFADTLKAAAVAYFMINGNIYASKGFTKKEAMTTLNIESEEEFEKLTKIYQDWALHMQSNGYYIQDYLKFRNTAELTKLEKLQGIYKPGNRLKKTFSMLKLKREARKPKKRKSPTKKPKVEEKQNEQ